MDDSLNAIMLIFLEHSPKYFSIDSISDASSPGLNLLFGPTP